MRTLEPFDSSMYLNMFVKVGFLREWQPTVWVLAHIGPFISMNPKVVKEVVPFAELFAAIFVVTFQHLDVAFGLGILESEYSELFAGWRMLFNLHRSQVKVAAILDKDWHIIWDTFEGITTIAKKAYLSQEFTII